MRGLRVLCAAFAAAGATAGAAHAQFGGARGFASAIERAAAAFEAGECEDALSAAPELVVDRRFAAARRSDQIALLTSWANCAIAAQDWRAVYDAFGHLAPIAEEPDWPLRGRMHLALDFNESLAAVVAFESWARVSPEAISTVDLRSIWTLVNQAGDLPGAEEASLSIHETLARVGYTPPGPLDTDEGLRVAHARLLMERGRSDDAARRLGGEVDNLRSLIELGADAAFDEVLAKPRPIDFAAAAERQIERYQALAASHPRLLEARYYHISALRDAGREAEALSEADRALADAAADPAAFDDVDEFVNWIHNDRAYSLYALGRVEEGRSAMRAAIAAGEGGAPNVSQVINLALLLSDEERSEEALSTLELMGQASPYGEMFAAMIRACTAVQRGDEAGLADALSYLREHGEENYSALQRGLLCANEADEAAALYIKRLGDPALRDGALIALQRWAPDPFSSPFREELRRRLAAVQSRSDVQAALSAVGRAQDVPFPMSYWGDL